MQITCPARDAQCHYGAVAISQEMSVAIVDLAGCAESDDGITQILAAGIPLIDSADNPSGTRE
jgi:hypothetical protein